MTTAGSLNKKLRGRACNFDIYSILFFFLLVSLFPDVCYHTTDRAEVCMACRNNVGCGEGNKALEVMRSVWEINWGMRSLVLSNITFKGHGQEGILRKSPPKH